MTVLENETIVVRNKHKRSKDRATSNLKRKCELRDHTPPVKRQILSDMLNGYRPDQRCNNGDAYTNDSPVATLSNMGNTCFLNSVLYTLRFAPTFLHNLHHLIGDLTLVNHRLGQTKAKTSSLGRNVGAITGPSARSTSSKDLLALGATASSDMPKSKVQIVTEKLHELFVTMHNLEAKESNEPYQPVAFLQAVREANSIFEGNHQQDAHELLVYLLDNIRETCDVLAMQLQQNPMILNEVETAPPSTINSKIWNVRRSWKKSTKKDKNNKEIINEEQINENQDGEDAGSVDSVNEFTRKRIGYNFVAEDFEGITLRRTKCLVCECVTERKEPFYDIPVPIAIKDEPGGDNNPSDIYRHACVTKENLCGANKYLCENCARYNEASREVLFEKLPNIMVLQLKRFTSSSSGVQKVNTYMPTPLKLKCFCESCCRLEEECEVPPHHYQLCCVIMHLGGAMASGHYIAYTKLANHADDYGDCGRDLPKGSLSASSSEKSLNLLKIFNRFKPFNSNSAGVGLIDNKLKNVGSELRLCKSFDCCGVKLNRSVVENVINSSMNRKNCDDVWLECDDENIRTITTQEFVEELADKKNSTSTPYLLFYVKITEPTI